MKKKKDLTKEEALNEIRKEFDRIEHEYSDILPIPLKDKNKLSESF